MTQQVNLYTDAFKPKKVILPLEHIVGLGVLAIVLVTIVTFALNMGLASDQTQQKELQAKAEVMAERRARMEEEVGLRVLDESLVAANQRLKDKVNARKDMIKMLESLVLNEAKGNFSSLMVALARQTSDDLWLNRIYVGTSGQTMSLTGTTLSADAVPAYLQRLREEDTFVGRNFTLFQLSADEDSRRRLNFELKSELSSDVAESDNNATNRVVPVMTVGGVQ